MPEADRPREGTALRVIAELVAWQVDLGREHGREWALTIVVDQLVAATQALIDASCDPDLQNEAQWLIDAYKYLHDYAMIELSIPDDL